MDLAKGFEARNKEKLSTAEIDQFMQNCVDLALQTVPNLITARLLQVELDKREFERTKNKLIYKQLEINITKLFADGYLELPEPMYSEQPKTVGLDSTYTPFAQENIREGTPTGKGKVLTLSNGRYDEFKNAKRIETIGSVRFNTEKNKIVGFGENKRQVEVVSRFLSVDPIAKQYPELTPYQFASNTPIMAIDLDGLEGKQVHELVEDKNGNTVLKKITIVVNVVVVSGTIGEYASDFVASEKEDVENSLKTFFAGKHKDPTTGVPVEFQFNVIHKNFSTQEIKTNADGSPRLDRNGQPKTRTINEEMTKTKLIQEVYKNREEVNGATNFPIYMFSQNGISGTDGGKTNIGVLVDSKGKEGLFIAIGHETLHFMLSNYNSSNGTSNNDFHHSLKGALGRPIEYPLLNKDIIKGMLKALPKQENKITEKQDTSTTDKN